MASFDWALDDTTASTGTGGEVLSIECSGPDDGETIYVRLWDYEMDALCAAWVQWRASEREKARTTRLLMAWEGAPHG